MSGPGDEGAAYRIRAGREGDLPALCALPADDDPADAAALDLCRAAGSLWVADREDAPAGFAAATELDGTLHLLALRVAPGHRRRGLGTRLLDAVIDHGRWAFHPAVTAVARREGPEAALLARRGFMTLRADALPPGLAARIAGDGGNPGLYALGKRL